MTPYLNRQDAGKILAEYVKPFVKHKSIIVLGLARGGVPVAYEVAKALEVPLDIFIVRKLGVPGYEELAMGAIATGDCTVFNPDVIHSLNISAEIITETIQLEKKELLRREKEYRGSKPFPSLAGKAVILVDDGIATGATMRAAVKALRELNVSRLIIAVPVAEISTCHQIAEIADVMVCPLQPLAFHAVGAWYLDFQQTTDEEVKALLSGNAA